MLFIEKHERSKLPPKYRAVHNICAIIYQQLVELLTSNDFSELSKTLLSTEANEMFQKDDKAESMHILEWLSTNKRTDELTEILTKHVTLAILADLLNFIYESLDCARNGKYTVAYALLRKPFTDELLLLEQVLNDEKGFILNFYYSEDSKQYDPSNTSLDKRKIINAAVEKVKVQFISADLIYKFRYDKAFETGINGMTNHALHIVTQNKNYQTKKGNLNFVFSTQEDFDYYLSHYYLIVPYLLIYTAEVVDRLLFPLMRGEEFEGIAALRSFKRFIAQIFVSEESKLLSKRTNSVLIKKLNSILSFTCEDCGKVKNLDRADLSLLFFTGMLVCDNCLSMLLKSRNSRQTIRDFLDVYQS